jgi:hypothetical protein
VLDSLTFLSWRGSLCKVRANEGNVTPHGGVWPGDGRGFKYICWKVSLGTIHLRVLFAKLMDCTDQGERAGRRMKQYF